MPTADKPKLKKRTWHYIYPPEFYEVHCDKGGTVNEKHKVAWSEFERLIWCFDCKEDMRGFGGIFDGPIPLEATLMILGQNCFDRYDMKRKVVLSMKITKDGKMVYRKNAELTERMLKAQEKR